MGKQFDKKHPIQKMMEQARKGVAPMEHDHIQEKALLIAFQNGDETAGFQLVKCYQDVFSVIISKPTKAPFNSESMRRLPNGDPCYSDYEDIYQAILLQFIEMAQEFDTEGETPFEHKVRRTLHQRFFNRYYSEFLENRLNEIEYDDKLDSGSTFDLTVDDAEKIPAHFLELYEAFNQLSKKQRQVIELSVMKGWSAPEVAKEIGTTHGAVRKLKERGMEKLKTIMGAE
jgi:RNA polymerase sigma factor (sigma-70 family)